MKNANIHETLNDKDIRDFLAQNLSNTYSGEVDSLKERISQLQKELERAVKAEAVLKLIDCKGWDYFDISDQISDYKPSTYFPFVGTEADLKLVGL